MYVLRGWNLDLEPGDPTSHSPFFILCPASPGDPLSGALWLREIRFLEPFGFFDFITLERNGFCVLSDSGTVQEECALFGVPNVTLRDVTERPETLECGSNILSGADSATITRCVQVVLSQKPSWHAPQEYLEENVSSRVVKILLGYHFPGRDVQA